MGILPMQNAGWKPVLRDPWLWHAAHAGASAPQGSAILPIEFMWTRWACVTAMNEPPTNPTPPDTPDQGLQPPELIEPAPTVPLHVGWIAGPETSERLGRTLQPLAIGLLDELIRLTVFCPHGSNLPALPSPPVEVVHYEQPKWWQWGRRGTDRLSRAVESAGVEVLHALDCTTITLTRKLARRMATPYVLSTYKAGAFGPVPTKLDPAVLGVHTTSLPLHEELLARKLIAPEKVHLIRPGVYPVKRPTCFAEPNQEPAIVVGGPLDRVECYQSVLESFAELRDAGHDCAYFIVGRGPGEPQLRELAEHLDLQTEVTFCEPLSATQMAGILKSADIYVSPAPTDLVDIQALVATAVGVPVVAAEEHVSDFLIDGQTARLVPPADCDALTDALAGMLNDHAAARRLCSDALAYIREHHSPANTVTAVACLYRGLTGGHDPVTAHSEA
jgi:glycosyltransferase involved in cell wall biosynthesis